MKINFNTSALEPMFNWLSERKRTGVGNEADLRNILTHPDYQVELARYGMEGLPVCGISLEEAVDFFMNFDHKDFGNLRLQYKKEGFLKFYEDLENQRNKFKEFLKFTESDYKVIQDLLENGLPESELKTLPELNIIFIISLGNSMGWPYDNYIDYDVSQLDSFTSKEDFLHVTAHEIHHLFMATLLAPEGIKGQEFFLQNFAFEGLAMHFCNNLETKYKKAKYPGKDYCVQKKDMAFYEENFDAIFSMIQKDYHDCEKLSLEQAASLVSEHYEKFTFMGKKVSQYPTYYFGAYMWGLVEEHYGKEKLFEAIDKPHLFVELYNSVAPEKYRF